MVGFAKSHKASILKEHKKRDERKKALQQSRLQEEEERRLRKEKRAALRERKRLADLKVSLQQELIQRAEMKEYNPSMKIYDVRDNVASSDGVIIIGGFVGELLITLTCLLDYILASPANQNFVFSSDMIQQYLLDILAADDSNYPVNTCVVDIIRPLEELMPGRDLDASTTAMIIREPSNLSSFGLASILELHKDLVLSADVIDSVFEVIAKYAIAKPAVHHEMKEFPEDASQEQKDAIIQTNQELKL